ncbi:MAG TPA: prolyl oligopeptidase family serine peptidase [Candidatus Acidoferrum sp.]|nr:prolyl oligopeptidase family serine peptidase [Candidatus Acidoferrum sp.]
MKRYLTPGCLLICAATILGLATSGAPQAPDGSAFTIDQVLSAPFPTELIAAPAKNRFAWEFNARGKRNVWIAEPGLDGHNISRQITSYSQDDGQDIGDFAFTPDANSLVYVHGGDFEFTQRDNPNPSAIADGVEQDIYVISLAGGEPRKITEGHSPAISPRGDAIAYLLQGEIWLANLDGSGKAQQLIHEMGRCRSLRWSPDGQSLAFVSSRGDHSFIGVYSFAAKTITYLDPSTDEDQDPVWSPDSSEMAFLRIPTLPEPDLERPERIGPPWSIRVADAATGKGREIWKAADGQGSVFRGVVAQDQLFWGDADRLVFPWERQGWTHLYSVPASGGTATLMTPGEFEVEDVSLSPDRKSIVFSSNQNDTDRRHVWRVAVGSASPVEVTSGTGIENSPVFASDNQTIAVFHSDARTPMRPAIVNGANQLTDLAADQIPKDFPASQLVVPQQVIFAAADGTQIHGQLFLPHNASDGARRPAIVFVHGGSRRQMLLGWHYMSYYSNAYALNQYLASRGFIVLSVNYRSGIGYGLNFREALNYGPTGASEYNDVIAAGSYLRNRSEVDTSRIGIWGGSYGGYLTALALARNSDVFAAGVDLQGVHDWVSDHPESQTPANPGTSVSTADAARIAWESSPLSSISKWRSPVLLIQGDDDRNVKFSQMVELAEALRKQHVDYEELVFPDEIHDFLLHRNWLAAYNATADFFRRHLAQ